MLHTLGFDFNVEHPYKHLLNVVKRVNQTQNVKESNSRSLAQVAWNFANDRSANLSHPFDAQVFQPSSQPNVSFFQSSNDAVLAVRCARHCERGFIPRCGPKRSDTPHVNTFFPKGEYELTSLLIAKICDTPCSFETFAFHFGFTGKLVG